MESWSGIVKGQGWSVTMQSLQCYYIQPLGLGGTIDVVESTIFSHEQTRRVCCFQIVDAKFSKDLLSCYFEITGVVFVLFGGHEKYPRILYFFSREVSHQLSSDIDKVLLFHYIFRSFQIVHIMWTELH